MHVYDEGTKAEQGQQRTLLPKITALGLEGLGDVAALGFCPFARAKLRQFGGGGAHAVPLLSSVRIRQVSVRVEMQLLRY